MATEVISVEQADLYGRRIYLLGTSDLGPVNTPVRAVSASHVKSVFGSQGSLLEAYRAIIETNFDCEVYLVKTTGIHSEVYLNINTVGGEIVKDGLYIKSKYANEKYDKIKIVIDPEALYIINEDNEVGEYTLEYKYRDNVTLHELAENINEDTRRLGGDVYCYVNCDPSTLSAGALAGVNPTMVNLSGGNSGLYYNKNMLYNCLSDTYAVLEGRDIDLILPLTANYDDTFTGKVDDLDSFYDLDREYLTLTNNSKYLSYYGQLLEFCINQMRFGMLTHGMMGMYPTKDPFIDEELYIGKLEHFKRVNEVEQDKKKYKQLISVCVGDLYNTFGTRVLNGYVAYSALVANLMVTENTTNKALPGTFTLYNTFSNEGLAKIMELGYTSFRYSPLKKSVVVSNGVTTSDKEEFKFLCNVRMSQIAMCYVRELLSSYIGSNIITLIKTKELEQSLVALLNKLASKNVIAGFSVNEVVNPVTGHIFIDMSFKTLYMTEAIKTYSGVAAIR